MTGAQPAAERDRLESLDVLRGFALLGILLLNVIGFGLVSGAYNNPALSMTSSLDLTVWGGVELFAEGAMRALFSMLFGAGVVMFTTGVNAKSGLLHYRRQCWLLAFGLFDAYVLLWSGDILVNYALGGMVLYWVRDVSASRLLTAALVMLVLMSLYHAVIRFGLHEAYLASLVADPDIDTQTLAQSWHTFAADYLPTPQALNQELALRGDSYVSAWQWNLGTTTNMLLVVLPMFLYWDALTLMLLGMALYKYGVLQGERDSAFYAKLALVGCSVGLLVNGYEVFQAVSTDFDLFHTFAQMQPTYHIGRVALACGYLGLILWIVQSGVMKSLRQRLANVGRMALSNYLMHSFIALLTFTGAGLGLVGELPRWQLYGFVVAVWAFQLWFSTWWLQRYRFGPLEWLWRGLTYQGDWPTMRR